MTADAPTSFWSFDLIARNDAARAAQLQAAPPCDCLFAQCQEALSAALTSGQMRVGFDEAGANGDDLRAVLQFPVAQQLFDWFFNAHTGYRAQFRLAWENGLARNQALIE